MQVNPAHGPEGVPFSAGGVRVWDLEVGYGDRVVLRIESLAFGPGLHLVLGPNGSGKTTLFRALAGVLPPRAGEVRVLGENPYRYPGIKGRIAYLAHRPALTPDVTLRDELRFWGSVYGLAPQAIRQRIEELDGLLGLGELLPLRTDRLSRGQRQRAALARALLHGPEVLLLDEPTTGLDPAGRRRVREAVRELARDRVLLYSTHNLYEARELAEDITFLRKGRVLFRSSLEEAIRLRQKEAKVYVRLRGDAEAAAKALREEGIVSERSGDGLVLRVQGEDAIARAVRLLAGRGFEVLEVRPEENPLEALFLELEGSEDGE